MGEQLLARAVHSTKIEMFKDFFVCLFVCLFVVVFLWLFINHLPVSNSIWITIFDNIACHQKFIKAPSSILEESPPLQFLA